MPTLFRALNILYAVSAIIELAILIWFKVRGDGPIGLGLILGLFLYPTAFLYPLAVIVAFLKHRPLSYTNVALAILSIPIIMGSFYPRLTEVILIFALFVLITIPSVALKQRYDHRRSAR